MANGIELYPVTDSQVVTVELAVPPLGPAGVEAIGELLLGATELLVSLEALAVADLVLTGPGVGFDPA